jgi:membrane protease subunit HflK
VQEAKGQTSRFLRVYEEYAKAPDVTRKRIYLETLERVLGRSDKIILDSGPGASSVVPYLPLTEPSRRANPPAPAATTGGQR